MAVTQAQYNAGKILVNVKHGELGRLHKKLQRLSTMITEKAKGPEMPYTEENLITLTQHSLASILSGNQMMVQFWMVCTIQIHNDIQHLIRLEHIRQHQARRIGKMADRIGRRVVEIDGEIKAIITRING